MARVATANGYAQAADNGIVDFACLASSWPGCVPTPSKLRPQPPPAPRRAPMKATWDVPPLELPSGPQVAVSRKRSPSGSSTTAGDDALELVLDEERDKEFLLDDERDEEGIFAFSALDGRDDSDDELGFGGDSRVAAFDLVGLDDGGPHDGHDDQDDVDKTSLVFDDVHKASLYSEAPVVTLSLGASPVLLSVLDYITAEAQSSKEQQNWESLGGSFRFSRRQTD